MTHIHLNKNKDLIIFVRYQVIEEGWMMYMSDWLVTMLMLCLLCGACCQLSLEPRKNRRP